MKSTIVIIIFLLAAPALLYAQEKKLTFIGDSRATELAGAEGGSQVVSKSLANGVSILADGELTAANTVNLSIPGSTTDKWVEIMMLNPAFKSYATFISIGGNDIRDMYGFLEYYKNLHSIQEAVYWMWQVEAVTDSIALKTGYIVKTMLDGDPGNKVILSEIAPVIDYRTKAWRWQFFYLANYMLSILNRKYQENLVDQLAVKYGDRIQLLAIYKDFLDNILHDNASYYDNGALTDFVHFGAAGLAEWGKMLAIRLGALGWYEMNGAMCSGDTVQPEFIVPPDGEITGLGILGLGTDVAINFQVTDDGELLEVTGGNITGTNGKTQSHSIIVSTNIADGTYERRITATDTCGNRTSCILRYGKRIAGIGPAYGYWWYTYSVSYNFIKL